MDKWTAAREGTKEIFTPVVSTSITLAVVFIPVIFLQGFTGRLFREFGIVVAGAVLISAFVSLTLTPVLNVKLGGDVQNTAGSTTSPTFPGHGSGVWLHAALLHAIPLGEPGHTCRLFRHDLVFQRNAEKRTGAAGGSQPDPFERHRTGRYRLRPDGKHHLRTVQDGDGLGAGTRNGIWHHGSRLWRSQHQLGFCQPFAQRPTGPRTLPATDLQPIAGHVPAHAAGAGFPQSGRNHFDRFRQGFAGTVCFANPGF